MRWRWTWHCGVICTPLTPVSFQQPHVTFEELETLHFKRHLEIRPGFVPEQDKAFLTLQMQS